MTGALFDGMTGVPVNHYARINFDHVASVVDALGAHQLDLGDTEEGEEAAQVALLVL